MQQMMIIPKLQAALRRRYAGAMKPLLALVTLALCACGSQQDAEPPTNEAARLTEQIQKQGEQIAKQADNGAAAIEQALENESAIIFENRGNLLNETAGNTAAPRQ
jgi:hypothetical protein